MANRKDQMASCHIHRGNSVSTKLLHYHHVIPQGYGGPDETHNTIWLCASCHDILHRLAYAVLSKKGGIAQDLANQYLPNSPKARMRLWGLVKTAADAMQTYIPDAGDTKETVMVSLDVPRWVHHRLKTLAQEVRHENGRKVGLARYCVEILKAHVETKSISPLNKSTETASSFEEFDDTLIPDT